MGDYRNNVRSLSELVAEPGLTGSVETVAGAVSSQQVRRISAIEDVHELQHAADGDLVVLTARASERLEPYLLDGALRVAASRGVAALVLTAADVPISRTSVALAQQTGVAVLKVVAVPLVRLIVALERGLSADADAAFDRLRNLSRLIAGLPVGETRVGDLLERAGRTLGHEIIELDATDDATAAVTAPVVIGGKIERRLAIAAGDDAAQLAAPIALPLLAGTVARITATARDVTEVPAISSTEIVTEMLLTDGPLGSQLVRRARAVGVPVDTWHIAMAIDLEAFAPLAGGDEVRAYEQRILLNREATATAEAHGGVWYRGRIGTSLILFRGDRLDPGHQAATSLVRTAQAVIDRILSIVPDVKLTCGIGTPYVGPHGMRATAAEAQAALRVARANERIGEPVLFDPASLHRTLVEWYASDTARSAVKEIMAPLDRLEPKKREEALRTLRTYLDTGGSFSRTAEIMHLHRNAVAYRVKNILKLLDIDLDESDQRLMLHLACRVHTLQ